MFKRLFRQIASEHDLPWLYIVKTFIPKIDNAFMVWSFEPDLLQFWLCFLFDVEIEHCSFLITKASISMHFHPLHKTLRLDHFDFQMQILEFQMELFSSELVQNSAANADLHITIKLRGLPTYESETFIFQKLLILFSQLVFLGVVVVVVCVNLYVLKESCRVRGTHYSSLCSL